MLFCKELMTRALQQHVNVRPHGRGYHTAVTLEHRQSIQMYTMMQRHWAVTALEGVLSWPRVQRCAADLSMTGVETPDADKTLQAARHNGGLMRLPLLPAALLHPHPKEGSCTRRVAIPFSISRMCSSIETFRQTIVVPS